MSRVRPRCASPQQRASRALLCEQRSDRAVEATGTTGGDACEDDLLDERVDEAVVATGGRLHETVPSSDVVGVERLVGFDPGHGGRRAEVEVATAAVAVVPESRRTATPATTCRAPSPSPPA